MQRLEIKSTITRVTMTLLMMLLTTMTAWAQFSGGDGSENNPYEIASYNDLLTLRNNVNNGETYRNCYFRQTADITWPDATTWDRGIGYSDTGSHYFRGRYDGNSMKITGFRLATSEQNAGLFGYVYGSYVGTNDPKNVIAEVKNVVLVDPVVTAQATSGEQYVGTLVGYVSRCVKIDDNTVIGGSVTITGVSNNDNSVYAGGLLGYYYNGDSPSLKRNIVSGTTVSGAGVSGGLVGRLYFSSCVDQNFVDATVSSVQHTGDAGTFYRQGAVVGECSDIFTNTTYYTWGYYHNTAGLTFFAKDENGNTKNDQPKTSRIYAVGIVPDDITVSGDGYHGFCGKHYCLSGASITLSGGTAPAGYLVSGYTSTDATITNGAFTMPAKDITVSATFTPDPVHFEQTGTNEYTIHTDTGWEVFCDLLADNAFGYFTGKTVRLGDDIGSAESPVTRMAGSSGHEFFGTFDGQQHTLTFSYGATGAYGNEQYVAPFRYVRGDNEQNPAIIQNLHVTGHIYTSTKYATGILAQQNGTVKIKNCHSSIVIHSSVSGDGSHGGLVGGISGTLSIDGCVFDGKLLTTGTTATNNCGGFVGWNGGTLTISNSLYAPAIIDTEHGEKEVVVGTSYPSATFSRNGATITNSYYTRTLGTAQGKAARSITAGDYVTIEAVSPVGSPVEDGTYTVSGITAYAKGITRGDAFYYGNGDEVSLTLNHAEPSAGYTFTGYTASAGTLDGTTLTMPGDGDVTINANYEFIKFTQGALSYECTSGTEVKVTACDNSQTSVTIPATVTDNNVTYTVTAIAADAFNDCTALTTVFMEPTTPPTLGDGAFDNCTAFHTIVVPTEVVLAYKDAWSDYANKILSIDGTCGDNVYWSYDSDSNTLTIFGTGAMADNRPWESYCDEIKMVDIRDGVTGIGAEAFSGCTILTSMTIPASVENIGAEGFNNCTALTEIIMLPTTPPTLGNGAFANCNELANIYVPIAAVDDYKAAWSNYATKIQGYDGTCGTNVYWSYNSESHKLTIFGTGDMADYFLYNSPWYSLRNDIKTVDIRDGVTSIGQHAFAGCTSLTMVFMEPTTPPMLGNHVFDACDELANIYVPAGTAETYKTTGNWATYKDIIQTGGTCGDNVYWSYNSESHKLTIFGTGDMTNDFEGNNWENYLNDIETVDIRDGVTSIGNYAFSFCNLSSINIPASVTTIGDYAFQGCWGLTSIEIPASVTTIGYAAFITCIYLTSINIPASVTTIGDWAFGNCTGLTSINIPASVTTIGYSTFINCSGLESISVAAGNTIYDSRNNCNALIETASNTLMLGCKNTVIPNSVASIGGGAFYGCEELKEITIPASVTSIGEQAFRGCASLTTVFMQPTTPPTLGNDVFDDRYELANIYVPAASLDDYKAAWTAYASKIQGYDGTYGDNVYWSYNSTSNTLTIFGTGAMADYSWYDRPWFSFRTDIKKVDIRAGVTTIGRQAFSDCTALTSIELPASVTTIDSYAFRDCSGLSSINIPASVTSIGDWAFGNCTGLTSINIPASVTSIGSEAFWDCASLTMVFMRPTTPPTLGNNVFYACNELASIYVPAASLDGYKAAWTAYATKIQGYDGTCGNNVFWAYDSDSHKLTIFGEGAMADNMLGKWPWSSFKKEITTVDVRDGVTTIGNHAFEWCTALTSIDLPASVTSIGYYAFSLCTALSSIELPASLTTICEKAFEWCTALTSIDLPASVTRIDSEAFARCYGLSAFVVDNGNTAYAAEDGVLFNKDKTTLHIYPIGNNRDTYTIPADVTCISIYAFYGCSYLTTVFMQPTTPPTLGNDAFDDCDKLANIYVPAASLDDYKDVWADYASKIQGYDGACGTNVYWSYDSDSKTLTIFGTGAMADDYYSNRPWFSFRNDITTVDIRNGVTTIGDGAFMYCYKLTSIDIPASVTSIATNAFYECEELESISVADGNTKYDSRNNCNALIETASNTLMLGCKNTVIPNSVTSIGGGAFYHCPDLTSITIPEGVTSIGAEAFSRSGLGYIIIPSSVTSIGGDAFNGCDLEEVWVLRLESPITQLGSDAFGDCADELTIYVPTDKVTDYKDAWTDYAEKIKGLDKITEIALVDKGDNSGLITAVNGVTLDVYLGSHTVWKDGDWNTLCLPFDVNITSGPLSGDNVLAMTLDKETSGLSGTTLTLNFTKATTIPAGTPFIIKWDNMHVIYHLSTFFDVKIDATDRSVTSADGYVTFKGTYDRLEWNTENNSILFLGTKNTLYYPQPSDGNYPSINAFHAYFQLNNGLTAEHVSAARMNFEEGEATGIKTTNSTNYTNSDAWYTLEGRKLEGKPTKAGLYIHGNRKVSIK